MVRPASFLGTLAPLAVLFPSGAAFVVSSAAPRPPARRSPRPLHVAPELVDPSYNLALGAFGAGLAGGFLEDVRDGAGDKLLTAKPAGALAVLFTVFSLFLAFQTTTLRFGFDPDSFSLVKSDGSSMGENVVVGGENRWRYSSFTNYDFLPSEQFPILVYFREDQTPLENREEVPIVVDNAAGQVHFFPAISNVQQLKQGFIKNGCARI